MQEQSFLDPIRVGICGFGTVGSGTFNVLARNSRDIAARVGRDVIVTHIGARRDNPRCDTGATRFSRDVFAVVRDPEVDIVVELIGGCDTARELVMEAIAAGKHVVTANKALIAQHGNEIFAAASARGVTVAFEAAVGGGIPIIKAIREGLAANRIDAIFGIVNGTCNFILSAMSDEGGDFGAVLAEAQRLGYAEADPSFDVDGIDAAHKLTILAALAFGIPLQFAKVHVEGIRQVSREDVAFAARLGYRIKHLGIARAQKHGIELRVHPAFVPARAPLANVNGVMNGVMVRGDAAGPVLLSGAGAGAEPTASSVVADLVDVVRALTSDPGNRVPHLAFQPETLEDQPVLDIADTETAYYLRLHVADEPGVLADVTRILADLAISIEAILQLDRADDAPTVPVVILTQVVKERAMNAAIARIEALSAVRAPVNRIRVEPLA